MNPVLDTKKSRCKIVSHERRYYFIYGKTF